MAQFGTPVNELTKQTFCRKGNIFQIGVAPRRIDIITAIDGIDFADAYATKEIIDLDGLKIPFISKTNLIKNKKATGREKDRLDANYLENSH